MKATVGSSSKHLGDHGMVRLGPVLLQKEGDRDDDGLKTVKAVTRGVRAAAIAPAAAAWGKQVVRVVTFGMVVQGATLFSGTVRWWSLAGYYGVHWTVEVNNGFMAAASPRW
ncbi:hypothetical protein L1987_01906 [Smallanthus sonchifolius]|uniref:Uncharacterized protein n=1 Tax=Smallanthus sonchifolius TaxID=185202 RepID=A0ACB9K692_9ASTR|nr:hypothetical protein L1987_01906 [Smallanthus sonchifolius]